MRISALDYVRGSMALGIMVYHYCAWAAMNVHGAETLIGRIGIYAVCVFYTLSGLTLYIGGEVGAREFWLRRVFRIFPMLWIATLGAFVLSHGAPGLAKLAMNLSGLFGFVEPGGYIATGSWSIGNELVFYAMFPALAGVVRRGLGWALIVGALAVQCVWCFFMLSPVASLYGQWDVYVNPLNHLVLFVAGVVMGCWCKGWRSGPVAVGLGLAAIGLFCVWPAAGDQVGIVTGWPRLYFDGVCVLAVLAAWVGREAVGRHWLVWFGETSYSIYLLHPLVLSGVIWLNVHDGVYAPEWVVIGLAAIATMASSAVAYTTVERPMIMVGRHIMRHYGLS